MAVPLSPRPSHRRLPPQIAVLPTRILRGPASQPRPMHQPSLLPCWSPPRGPLGRLGHGPYRRNPNAYYNNNADQPATGELAHRLLTNCSAALGDGADARCRAGALWRCLGAIEHLSSANRTSGCSNVDIVRVQRDALTSARCCVLKTRRLIAPTPRQGAPAASCRAMTPTAYGPQRFRWNQPPGLPQAHRLHTRLSLLPRFVCKKCKMPAWGLRSPSATSDHAPSPYDPFHSPHDPIEMSAACDSPGPYRGYVDSPQAGHGEYAPLPERGPQRMPTHKSEGASSARTSASLARYKTRDADAQALVDRRAGEVAQWKIHWQTPAAAVALFVCGVLSAVGHHIFYDHFDGQTAGNQLVMVQYGTALAFFTKSALVGSVLLCYRQRIWHTFRNKTMTIKAIDSLFSAPENLTQFQNMEMIRNGKLATAMALASWYVHCTAGTGPGSSLFLG